MWCGGVVVSDVVVQECVALCARANAAVMGCCPPAARVMVCRARPIGVGAVAVLRDGRRACARSRNIVPRARHSRVAC